MVSDSSYVFGWPEASGTASWALTCGPTGEADDTQVFWSRGLEEEAQGINLSRALGVEYAKTQIWAEENLP